ncbi:pyruvate formate-lyase 2-activating enzyme [Anaeramoeba flamelloides]|uniref:Pyruvate formate-lyase 2-activating enzyme n=1 Tax=Anaeramoeba flamelloides TaxID=1746091 RepID=A0ABQ8Z2T9_9EUKA|nr:pyruvate formate-lyase 2-activating enzyme [Anaeramoeba flamelloides]
MSFLVSNIQRFSIHDGPGIRTTIFLKGCGLRCLWCQNPESIRSKPELLFDQKKCLGCRKCIEKCPFNIDNTKGFLSSKEAFEKCNDCFECVKACPTNALTQIGDRITIDDLMAQVSRDRHYYKHSGGGITFSGGEPLLQSKPLKAFLELCQMENIHTLIETAGYVNWKNFEQVLPFVDRWYYDLKTGNTKLHQKIVGVDPELIWDNASKLINAIGLEEAKRKINFRMPVVPGINDTMESLEGLKHLLLKLKIPKLTLLPYHNFGEIKLQKIKPLPKIKQLGIENEKSNLALSKVEKFFKNNGIAISIEQGLFNDQTKNETQTKIKVENRIKKIKNKSLIKHKHHDYTLSTRIEKLKRDYFSLKPGICTERSDNLYRYYKNEENLKKPIIIQRAESIISILTNSTTKIYDDELLVGSWNSKRVGGSIYPEISHIVALLNELFKFDSRKINPLRITKKEKYKLLKQLPFWMKNSFISNFIKRSGTHTVSTLIDALKVERFFINELGGIGHYCPDNKKLITLGTTGIKRQASKLQKKTDDLNRKNFYDSIITVCDGLEKWAGNYSKLAKDLANKLDDNNPRKKELFKISNICDRVPKYPARTFHEALQSILFIQIAFNMESLDNGISPGRLDQILYPYYKSDIQKGILTREQAFELLCSFSIKLSELVPVMDTNTGDIHGGHLAGQVVCIGGVDPEGNDSTNELSMIFLDVMNKLRIRQPNWWARIHPNSPEEFLKKISTNLIDEVHSPALVNDEKAIPILLNKNVTLRDARNYIPLGCVELIPSHQVVGSTDAGMINLVYPLELTLGLKKRGKRKIKNKKKQLYNCKSIDDLVELYAIQLDKLIDDFMIDLTLIERVHSELFPTPLISTFLEGCIESGIDVTQGSTKYVWSGVQGIGAPDVADSLIAIDQVIFKEKYCDLKTLRRALKRNFVGYECLRNKLLNAPKYGNDIPVVDNMLSRIMKLYNDLLNRRINTRNGKLCAGFYSTTIHTVFGTNSHALPNGSLKGTTLSNGLSPAVGNDRLGPTAALNSASNLDVNSAENGLTFNLTLNSNVLYGEQGVNNMQSLIQGYFENGGLQTQINVFDVKQLEDAYENPEKYPHLLVRVSGYTAYFNDLTPKMKREIIDRERKRKL